MLDGWYEGTFGTTHYVQNGLVICRAIVKIKPDRKWRLEDLIDVLTCKHCGRKRFA